MNRMASAELTSAENTAASPIAPMAGGRPRVRTVGSASSWFARFGANACAMIPSSGGTAANRSNATPASPTPSRTVRSSRAPYTFWISPGEMMNAGTRSAMYTTPERPLFQKPK